VAAQALVLPALLAVFDFNLIVGLGEGTRLAPVHTADVAATVAINTITLANHVVNVTQRATP